jgi:hypothetical protein
MKAQNVLFLGVCDTFSFSLSCSSDVPLAVSKPLPTSGQLFVLGGPSVVLSRDGNLLLMCCSSSSHFLFPLTPNVHDGRVLLSSDDGECFDGQSG